MTDILAVDRAAELNAQFESAHPREILQWALREYHPRVALSTSFQASGVVILDLLTRMHASPRIITLDTGRLPQATHELIERVRRKYGVSIEVVFPDAERVERVVNEHGVNLFYQSLDLRRLCCQVRKVEPLTRALKGLAAWITGIRREQSITRSAIQKFEVDRRHGGILKINPLADWTAEQVWEYIRANGVPYNPLYDQGYASIGCSPCTRAVKPGEEERAGRWWWENAETKECGLHR